MNRVCADDVLFCFFQYDLIYWERTREREKVMSHHNRAPQTLNNIGDLLTIILPFIISKSESEELAKSILNTVKHNTLLNQYQKLRRRATD